MKNTFNRDWLESYKTNPKKDNIIYKNYQNPSLSKWDTQMGSLSPTQKERYSQFLNTIPDELKGLSAGEMQKYLQDINEKQGTLDKEKSGYDQQIKNIKAQHEARKQAEEQRHHEGRRQAEVQRQAEAQRQAQLKMQQVASRKQAEAQRQAQQTSVYRGPNIAHLEAKRSRILADIIKWQEEKRIYDDPAKTVSVGQGTTWIRHDPNAKLERQNQANQLIQFYQNNLNQVDREISALKK